MVSPIITFYLRKTPHHWGFVSNINSDSASTRLTDLANIFRIKYPWSLNLSPNISNLRYMETVFQHPLASYSLDPQVGYNTNWLHECIDISVLIRNDSNRSGRTITWSCIPPGLLQHIYFSTFNIIMPLSSSLKVSTPCGTILSTTNQPASIYSHMTWKGTFPGTHFSAITIP